MENEPAWETVGIVTDAPLAAATEQLDVASQPFVGQWTQLVSSTNWEKGRIIRQWREALIAAAAPAAEYSDDAWARRVGSVTGQHVGRLRRVSERFGEVHADYSGLYWSHFHAALDWDDAEMWLEGAVQSRWSVSRMRRQRWEATGAVESQRPNDDEIVVADTDEDVDASDAQDASAAGRTGDAEERNQRPVPEGPDFGDEPSPAESDGEALGENISSESAEFVRPFENLSELPADLADAFEHFKLAVLRHKTDGWSQIARDDVLAVLDALKELALAPSLD